MRKNKAKTAARRKAVCSGALAGFMNAATGGGGGLVLLLLYGRDRGIAKERLYAIAITCALGFTLLSAGAYAAFGRLQWDLALKAVPAMTAGGYIGARLIAKLSRRVLQGILGGCLLASGACMLLLQP